MKPKHWPWLSRGQFFARRTVTAAGSALAAAPQEVTLTFTDTLEAAILEPYGDGREWH
jgi:hypothetical protein